MNSIELNIYMLSEQKEVSKYIFALRVILPKIGFINVFIEL